MAERSTPEQRAVGVARVLAGESRRKVAREAGVSDATVRRWVAAAERRGTAQEKKLAERADEIGGEIEERLVVARDKLLDRLVEVTPHAKGVQSIAVAMGIVSDKLALLRGEPTDRTEHMTQSEFDREVSDLIDQVKAASTNGRRPRAATKTR